MKTAESEQISRDLNGSSRTLRVDLAATTTSGSCPDVTNPSATIRSQPPQGFDTDSTEASFRNQRQNPPGNSARVSRTPVESRELTTHATSNENITSTNNMHHHIDKENEPSMFAPKRNYPDTSDEWRDEDRTEIPSSSASTASSFLQAAAIPPRLVTQETTPGAVFVPGLVGSFDDDQHDNLLDMVENDNNNMSNNSSGMVSRFSTGRSGAGATIQSPESTSFTLYSQSTPISTPIVAELAPSHSYSEREVEDRLAERLEAQMEAQITERLQQEVDRRFSMDKRQHVVAEVISSSEDSGDMDNTKVQKTEEENFKICGIRRTWWGMIICVIMLLTIAAIGSTYLWYSRAREIISNNTDNAPSQSPSTDASTMSPTYLSPSANVISTGPQPSDIVNSTEVPTPTPQESTEPTTTLPVILSTEQRRNYLITKIGPYVVPDEFVDAPAIYFANNSFQRDALDWMTTVNIETGIVDTPVQLLIERYVLAVLYYSTGGPEIWTETFSFLSSWNVCNWNNEHDIHQAIIGDAGTIEGNPGISEEPIEYTVEKKGVFCEGGSMYVTRIELPDNSLHGKVPWELSLLSYLSHINFDVNNFQGSMPKELGNLSRLEALWFKSNYLTGVLPIELSNATELASIDIEDNKITSVLPSEWGSLSHLFYVGLGRNNITGTLPSDWRKLNQLETLDLAGNQLRGTIPEEYGELTGLVSLYLESNGLDGPLPTTFGNLTNLANFLIDNNHFSGTVPTEYSALVNLEYFWFHQNSLTGSVDLTLCNSFLRPIDMNFKSNCLGNDLAGIQAQIQCSCCTVCCDSNGTNCEVNRLQ